MKTDVTAKNESQSLTFPLDISQTKKDRKLQIGSEKAPRNSLSRPQEVFRFSKW